MDNLDTAESTESMEEPFSEFMYNEAVYMTKTGTTEVYDTDCTTFVGNLTGADDKLTIMSWYWKSFPYKNSKGYYKNHRNDVVKEKDGVVSFIGSYNPASKNIDDIAVPPDINLAEIRFST